MLQNLSRAPVTGFIAKVSLDGRALAWGLDPRCPGQTCRIHIPLPYHELGLHNIDPNNDKGSY